MQNNLLNELGTNFIEYAVAVNTDRAIPDAKSGLKPVAKRILYGAFDEGYGSAKPHVKCANIVGNVMAYWHPHGDSSIYGALVRLSQPWVMRYPLIDFHGSNGNRDGDGPAAYRYTEARLSKLSEDGMLKGIKKNKVEFIPNYSETKDEPVTLPSLFPNLLCNPNTGIGVAMACNWLPHNLNEVVDAITTYLDGKEPTLPGPDFPTGGIIINKNDIPAIMKTGKGSVKIRGKYNIEDNNIVFYEIPYGIATEDLMNEIGLACDEDRIKGVKNIRNESNKKGFRLVIECEKSASIATIINCLFKETSLQTSISYNQVALVDKTPTDLNLRDCIGIYVKHNVECIVREAQYDLKKTQDKLEVTNGLLKALEDIDNIITLIKKSESSVKAKENLVSTYDFSMAQAEAIVNMKLGKLAGLEKIELQNEKASLEQDVVNCMAIITNPLDELRTLLKTLVSQYGDARRTELMQLIEDKEDETAFVEPEKCVVVMTESGNVKRIPASSFKVSNRNTKGVKTQDDITSCVIRTNTVDTLLVFTNKGTMYRLLVDNIPEGTNSAKGTSLKALIEMEADEKPQVIYSINKGTEAQYVLFLTKNGVIKKTPIDEYIGTKRSGVVATKLREGDSLAAIALVSDEDLVLYTAKGQGIRFNSKEVTATSRNTVGVKGITLNDGDSVLGMAIVRDSNDDVAVFAKNGMGLKIKLADLTAQSRGGKGVILHKEGLAGVSLVNDSDNLLICGNKSSICISAKDVPMLNRGAQGNIIIKANNIQSVSKI